MRVRTALAVVLVAFLLLVGLLLLGLRRPRLGPVSGPEERASSWGASRRGLPGSGEAGAQADAPGVARVQGVVLDVTDSPVGGAVVMLSSSPPRTALSNENGEFAFGGLLSGPYTLAARAEAGVAGPLAAQAAASPEVVTLRLRPAALVAVNVLVADGLKPLEAASIELRGIEIRAGRSDAKGRVLFPSVVPGTYRAAAWAPGFARAMAHLYVPAASTPGAVVAEITVRLRRGAPVSGTVRDSEGRPVARALVSYLGTGDPWAAPDLERDGVETSADGRYQLAAVPAGTYRFLAKSSDSAPSTSAPLTLDGERPRDGVDITLAAGALLAGQVVTSDAKPVAQARVTITDLRAGRPTAELRRVVCDGEGRFEARGLRRGEVSVFAESEGATGSVLRLDLGKLGEKRDLLLTLDSTGAISGLVVTPAGEPIAKVSVGVVRKEADHGASLARLVLRGGGRGGATDRLAAPALTDAAGRFTLRGLAEGRYRLRAEPAGGGPFSAAGLRHGGGPSAQVVAATGDREVRLVLPAAGGVRGKVVRPGGSPVTTFTVALSRSSAATPFTAADGSFLIEDQAPGQRELFVSGADFEIVQRVVTIKAGEVADVGTITVTPSRAINGVVRDPAGAPVAGATVRADHRFGGSGAALEEDFSLSAYAVGGGHSAVTDQSGAYSLHGEGHWNLFLVAEHERLGRSRPVEVPAGTRDARVDLTLESFGALEGSVIARRAPQSGVTVSVSSPGLRLAVVTGDDGTFRFDRLAPDRYLVRAERVGRRGSVAQTVKVASGAVAKVTFEAIGGSNLRVQALLADGTKPGFAMMRFSETPFSARTLSALEDESISRAVGFQGQATAPGGLAEIRDVPAGSLSVCAAGTPPGVATLQAVGAYLGRMVTRMRVGCVTIEVGSGVDKSVTLEIPDPPAPAP